jgi:predicted nucleic acid-binding protein
MGRTVLVDSGALVAVLRKRDQHHEWARSHFEGLDQPCLTCEAVVSESFFLLERAPLGKEALCALLDRGVITVCFSFPQHLAQTLALIRRYRDTPMSFADACMVRMAEIFNNSVIFTTDSDFETYRKNGRQTIPLITPW